MIALVALLLCAPAASAGFTRLDTPGPRLKVSAAEAKRAVTCAGDLANATRPPVLLLHGTSVDSEINWSWNYMPKLSEHGIAWCALDSPKNGEEDIQISSEYIVRTIRRMHRVSGQKVSMIGHSQGGMVGRWPLRWWPDIRKKVDDYVGFAGTNHGSTAFTCDASCTAAGWQQHAASNFIRALNSRTETFEGLSYTNIYTHTDETVQPADGRHRLLFASRGPGRDHQRRDAGPVPRRMSTST